MSATKMTGLAALICAGMFCTGTAWAQSAGDNAVQAAMDACENAKEMNDETMNCWMGAMSMQQSMQHASKGSEGMMHFDFDSSNDTPEQKAAKEALASSMNDCQTSGDKGSEIQNCRMEAFHQYQEAMGQ